MRDAAKLLEGLAKEKDVKIVFSDEADTEVAIDIEKMRQVFTNLFSNAIKFTDQGEIQVKSQLQNDKIQIYIKDNGIGLAAEHLTAIFDRFYQVPSRNGQRVKGTGLGLAIAKGWTEAHGGRLWAESDGIGKGTTFIVELPVG